MFIGLLSTCTTGSFGGSLASNSERRLNCISLNNRSCQARLITFDIKSNKSFYYPFTVSVSRCGGRCNNIDDPSAQVSISSKAKIYKCESI